MTRYETIYVLIPTSMETRVKTDSKARVAKHRTQVSIEDIIEDDERHNPRFASCPDPEGAIPTASAKSHPINTYTQTADSVFMSSQNTHTLAS